MTSAWIHSLWIASFILYKYCVIKKAESIVALKILSMVLFVVYHLLTGFFVLFVFTYEIEFFTLQYKSNEFSASRKIQTIV